ncbi:peptidylprolyl isomerase [Pseudorhodoferax sp.]|uniref:peptidylprolyl isomerase n=1 Tax=Pseudorhodoferax sp. TaxID=1993553 RepID=UPI0039E493B6
MKKTLYSAVAAAFVLGAAAMPALAQNIAIVNGKAVPKARMDALAEQMARAGRPVAPEQEEQLREEVIMREIFMQEAQKRGLDATPDFQAQMEFARQSLLVRELLVDYQKTHPVTDEEIQAEYDKVKAANAGNGKEYKAQHILVEKEADAKAIIASLKKGAKFEDIAKKQSKDPGSGANGGDLGWANPAGYVKEFGDALVQLKKGQITETPVKTQFGYHVIKLNDERTQEFPPLEQVKPQIAQQLAQQKMAQFQQDLRAKAKIE